MRDMCMVKLSLGNRGNVHIDTILAKTGNSYKTTSESESPDQGHQGCLPGCETASVAVAADLFDLTESELYRLHLLGCFPEPVLCEDYLPRWWFWELVLWAMSGCPPVAEWDVEAALEEHRDWFRRAVRMHLERLGYNASEVSCEFLSTESQGCNAVVEPTAQGFGEGHFIMEIRNA